MAKKRFRVIDGGRKWTKPGAYGAPEPKRESVWRKYGPLVAATTLLGGIIGAGMVLPGQLPSGGAPASEAAAPPATTAAPQTEAPRQQAAEPPEDTVVPETLVESGSDAASGQRVSFGLCVWGGGTNCVVDGDTFYLNGDKVRIAGIDAPETHDFKCPAEKALGDRSTARLRELLNSGPITMTNIDRDRDRYGRLLRNVTVGGADVGDRLIEEGLARPYRGAKLGWCQ